MFWAASSFFVYLGLHQNYSSADGAVVTTLRNTKKKYTHERRADKNLSFLWHFPCFPQFYFSAIHAGTDMHVCMPVPLSVSSAWLPSLLQDKHLAFAESCRWVMSDTHTHGAAVWIWHSFANQPAAPFVELEVQKGWLNIQKERLLCSCGWNVGW